MAIDVTVSGLNTVVDVTMASQPDPITVDGGAIVVVEDYGGLENKPSINNTTLIGNKTSSEIGVADAVHTHTKSDITDFPTLATVATTGDYDDLSNKPSIHNVPSGGTSGQILTKNSNTDYDLKWSNAGSGTVNDVQVDGTSVVSSGIATIPKANSTHFGVVKIGTQPQGIGSISIDGGYDIGFPLLMSNDNDRIHYTRLPEAKSAYRGAITMTSHTGSPLERYVALAGDSTYNVPFLSSPDLKISAGHLPDSGVTAGTYDGGAVKGSGYYVPSITVDSAGRITSATDLGDLIPLATGSSATNEFGNLVAGYAYRSLARIPSLSPSYVLSAGNTTATFTLKDLYCFYGDDYVFQVLSVEAVNESGNGVIVDWSLDHAVSTGGKYNAIQLTVSIAEAYSENIYVKPIVSYASMM